jgi:hypothetical protein
MNKYYVEFKDTKQTKGIAYIYVKAYSEEQIRDMFDGYDIVAIDVTNVYGNQIGEQNENL